MGEPIQPGPALRHLNAPLLAAILAVPMIFAWFLLRRGYSKSLRSAAFLYTGLNVALSFLGSL